MAGSTGLVLAAGGIAAANEVLFAPAAHPGKSTPAFNWRLVPATAVLALTLAGLEQLSPQLGRGLAALVLLAVLVVPVGHAGTPVDNIARLVGAA